MSAFAVADCAMVAGANAGAGAEETVCVRETADRDLSRNSMIVLGGLSLRTNKHVATYLRVRDSLEQMIVVGRKSFGQWNHEGWKRACMCRHYAGRKHQ